jgi:hypothetical protein
MELVRDIGIVKQRLLDLEQRVKALEGKHAHAKIREFEVDLPYYLYRTWHALRRGSVTAAEMSAVTERARAVESKYLNMLVALGVARKQRDGRKVVFTLIQKSNSSD